MSRDPYSPDNWLGRALQRLVRAIQHHAVPVIMLWLAGSTAAGWYAVHHLGINTDTTDMISAELDWRGDFIEFREAFPSLWRSLVVVIDADSADLAESARRALLERIVEREDLFVFREGTDSDTFFERHGLLYRDVETLEALSDRLAEIQPFLGRLSRDPTLRGFADMMSLAAQARARGTPLALGGLTGELEEALRAAAEDRFHRFPWLDLMSPPAASDPGAGTRRLILLEPRLDPERVAPAREPIRYLQRLAGDLDLDAAHGVRVRLTGPVALEYEELQSVTRGAAVGGLAALVMVLLVLYVGLRSPVLVVSALLTLVSGLVITAAFAAFAVGRLNLISVAFAVLYIGLGIDFSAHFCLRYRELLRHGVPAVPALRNTASDVGASLILCAVTTSIGFFAFYPTAFTGVSELGLISGAGMYISLAANLLLLPALLHLLPAGVAPREAPGVPPVEASPVDGADGSADAAAPVFVTAEVGHSLPFPQRRPRLVLAAASTALVAGVLALPLVEFDPNPLNLRDPAAGSVTAYRDLLEDSTTSPLTLNLIVDELPRAREAAGAAEALPLVAESRTIASFVPGGQEEKLALLEELAFIIGADLRVGDAGRLDHEQRTAALETLREALEALAAPAGDAGEIAGAAPALAALRRFRAVLASLPEADAVRRLEAFERSLMAGFAPQLARLERALQAGPVTLQDLPRDLLSRWRTPDGRYRVELVPTENLADNDAMRRFVDQVKTLYGRATGLPVVQLGAGEAVSAAFLQAIGSALALVGLLLLILLRSWRDTLQVVGPVVLASVLTAAATVLLGIDFNFANVIALPLLLGMGVDNGIHLVHRYRSAPPADGNLLATSTSRAILVSAVTTIVSFGNLAVSEHPGTASMGVVLATGLMLILLCTLLVLPALLQLQSQREGA